MNHIDCGCEVCKGNSKMRAEANKWASCILMPKKEIQKQIWRGVTDPEALAKIFDVPAHSMRIRLRSINAPDYMDFGQEQI